MYRHVIWDFDGTLFDTYPAMSYALVQALKNHGYDAPYEEVYALRKQSEAAAFEYYAARVDWSDDIVKECAAIRRSIETDVCAPYPGALELLREIIARGGKNYIYTHRGVTLWPMLDRHGLRDAFVECVTSENGFARKPAPDGIEYLVRKYGMDPAETVMVGDRELDILSGINAGIRTCAYCDGSGQEITCADSLARNMEELRAILLAD